MNVKKLFSGVSLVAGTSIGAAALALPVVSSGLGLYGTFVIFLLCWLVMYFAGIMVLEVSMSCGSEKSFISMTQYTLGEKFKWSIAVLYSVLLYSLLAAYFRGGADLVHAIITIFSDANIPTFYESLPYIFLTTFILYKGVEFIDYYNKFMVFGLVVSFLILVLSCVTAIDLKSDIPNNIFTANNLIKFLPVVITAFGYQVVIPSIRHYLSDVPEILPKVIFYGSLMPFVLYMIWSLLIYFALPYSGSFSILSLQNSAQPAVDLPLYLNNIFKSKIITNAISCFEFFALTSSVFGVAISLFDFLADRLMYASHTCSRKIVIALTIVPPALFALFYPEGFMLALSFAGIFVAILNGILPVVMLYKLRLKQNKKISSYDFITMLLVMIVSILLLLNLLA